METKFNFNSAICTSREQSEKLLALGLKKETADMGWQIISINGETVEMKTEDNWERQEVVKNHFPAWSLHRLIEMMPYSIEVHNATWCLQVSKGFVRYAKLGKEKVYVGFIRKPNTYDAILDCIEWLIKEGYFDKEYLV